MDSQILGDIQIIQQLKKSYKLTASNYSQAFHELIQAVLGRISEQETESKFCLRMCHRMDIFATQNVIKEFTDISNIKVLFNWRWKDG